METISKLIQGIGIIKMAVPSSSTSSPSDIQVGDKEVTVTISVTYRLK